MSDGAAFDLSAVLKLNVGQLQAGLNSVSNAVNGFASRAQSAMGGLNARLQSAQQQLANVASAANRAGQVVASGLGNATKAATGLSVAVGGLSAKLVSLASDANEASSKFGYVFGAAAEKTGKSLDEFAKAAGRSRYALRSTAADIGALLSPMGVTAQKTGELSVAVSKLAVDLSSFFNVSESDALMALKSGLAGEAMPLRQFGITLNEAKIKQEAFRLGLVKAKEEMTSAAKAEAILSLVFKETQQAQGDAIRTGDQFANSIRRTRDFIVDAATDLGQSLIPAATKYIRAIGDAAQPLAAWAKANQKILEQRVEQILAKVESAAIGVSNAFVELWKASEPLRDSLGGVGDKIRDIAKQGQELFNSLPKWAQNAILVGGALTGISAGLGAIGGSIPFVGQFATALGALISPLKIVRGLIAFIGPAMGVIFSPVTLTVGAAAAAVYGLVKTFQLAYDKSETFRDAWDAIGDTVARFVDAAKARFDKWVKDNGATFDRIADKASEAFEKIKTAVGSAATWMADKLGAGLSALTGGEVKDFSDALDAVAEIADGMLDGFEALLDWFNGDGRGLKSAAIGLQIAWNEAAASISEALAEIVDGASKMLYGPAGKILATVNPEFADLYMHYAQENTDTVTGSLKQSAAGRRAKNVGLAGDLANNELDRTKDKQARDAEIVKKKQKAQVENFVDRAMDLGGKAKDAIGGVFGGLFGGKNTKDTKAQQAEKQAKSKDIIDLLAGGKFGEAVAKGQVEYQRQHPSDVAQADAEVSKAKQGASPNQAPAVQKNPGAMFSNLLQGGASNVKSGLSLEASNQSASMAMVASASGASASNPGMQALAAFGQQIMQQISMVSKLDGDAKQQQIQTVEQMRNAFAGLVAGVVNGKLKLGDMADAVEKATKDMDNLDQAEKDKLAQANGQPTAAQQQLMQQQQQMAQQIQQGMMNAANQAAQQMGQQAFDSGQAMLQQAMGGPGQVQAMIDEAASKGDMKTANKLIRDRILAQLAVSKTNLHNLASDPAAGGGFGASNGGVSNDAYFMTLDIPLVRLIKFLQAQLDHLPKMAMGGIVTGPTNALIGEAGPEAVLPLTSFTNMLGALPVFGGIQNAMQKLGDFINNQGNFFTGQRNLSFNPQLAQQYFTNLSKLQDTFDYTSDRINNAGGVNFMPGGMAETPAMLAAERHRMATSSGLPRSNTGHTFNVQGIHINASGLDLTNPANAQKVASQIFRSLDLEAQRLGRNMVGGSALLSNTPGVGGRAVGYPR